MSTQHNTNTISTGPGPQSSGPFLARVISHHDPTYMGILEVELLRPTGNTSSEGQVQQVKYVSPFYGVTSAAHTSQNNDYNGTQKSYGMWMIPPDPGTTVLVFFVDGDPKRGYWMGCVQDENMNFMIPGIAATQQVVEGGGRLPVAEYNKRANSVATDGTAVKKPKHPLADVLQRQGLLKDDVRGTTTSSARRETPSMVFGISTPGPLDKRPGAARGTIGKKEHQIANAFVSRLGGSTFVMDDGDDKFIRKGPAATTPAEYVAVEQGETGGDRSIPHNELVRIRTRTGHQILLHNSEDLIYIGNAGGTTWIEMTSNGKIDIYAGDSVSIHSTADLNFTADRDINLTAKNNVNVNAATDFRVSAGGESSILAGGNHTERAAQIHMNGPTPPAAPKANRVPMAEPWGGHENLNPSAVSTSNTKASNNPASSTPGNFNKPTTSTDTFNKVKGPTR